MIHFSCLTCGKKMTADPSLSWRRVQCPDCRTIIEVPGPVKPVLVERPAEAVAGAPAFPATSARVVIEHRPPPLTPGGRGRLYPPVVPPPARRRSRSGKPTRRPWAWKTLTLVFGCLLLILFLATRPERRPRPNRLSPLGQPDGFIARSNANELATLERRSGHTASENRPAPPEGDEPAPDPDPETRARVARLTEQLFAADHAGQIEAARALADLGPKARSASRALCETLVPDDRHNPDAVRAAARDALRRTDPRLYALVEPLLFDRDGARAAEAVRQLERRGQAARAAAPALTARWNASPNDVPTLKALVAVAPDEEAVTRLLVACLAKNAHTQCRAFAARALPGVIGGKEQVMELTFALRFDPAHRVRAAAAGALGDLGDDAREARVHLLAARTDPWADVRAAAQQALAKLRATE